MRASTPNPPYSQKVPSRLITSTSVRKNEETRKFALQLPTVERRGVTVYAWTHSARRAGSNSRSAHLMNCCCWSPPI
jgi:hypothetical protein